MVIDYDGLLFYVRQINWIIGLSMYEDLERAQALRDAGASDYKTKGCAASELVSAIRDCVLRQ